MNPSALEDRTPFRRCHASSLHQSATTCADSLATRTFPLAMIGRGNLQVRFLLETATTETAQAVVREIREGLRLSPVSGGGGGGMDTEETEALVLDSGLGGGGRGREKSP